jgi:hypothetical protein
MEYTYIKDIDKIIEDKDKLKEVLLYILKTNAKRYDDYSTSELYDLFCEEPLDAFIDVLNNMIYCGQQLREFKKYVYTFHARKKVDVQNKIEYLIIQEYSYVNDSIGEISFEEYLFKCHTFEVTDCLEYMVKYYEKNNELHILEKKIENFEVFRYKDEKKIWIALNLKYIITYLSKEIKSKKFIGFCRNTLKKYFSEKNEDLQLYNKLWRRIAKENKC